jgi:spore maturation protein CgeB
MLLQNQDFRSRLGNAARNTVLQHHTLNHRAEQLAHMYRECAR